MKTVVKYVYIPGTKIPWMTSKLGRSTQRAGEKARQAPTQAHAKDISQGIAMEIAKAMRTATGDTIAHTSNIMLAAEQGILEGLAELHNDIERTPPTIPKDTGTLRNSWFTTAFGEKVKGSVGVEAGFSTADQSPDSKEYALYVHEMTDQAYGKKINWSEPGSGPKFLEYGLKRNAQNILSAVARNIKMVTR